MVALHRDHSVDCIHNIDIDLPGKVTGTGFHLEAFGAEWVRAQHQQVQAHCVGRGVRVLCLGGDSVWGPLIRFMVEHR